MKAILNPLRFAIFLLMTAGWSGWSQGVIVWNGPIISFNHPDGVGTSVQDHLTPGVWLTRGTSEGLFNVAVEGAYTKKSNSPQDTAWAYGSLTDYASLSYLTWEQCNGKNPPSMVGQPAVVHLISENIYLSLTFTSFGGLGGSYSYDRSTSLTVPEPAVWALVGLSGWCALVVIAHRKRIARAQTPSGT